MTDKMTDKPVDKAPRTPTDRRDPRDPNEPATAEEMQVIYDGLDALVRAVTATLALVTAKLDTALSIEAADPEEAEKGWLSGYLIDKLVLGNLPALAKGASTVPYCAVAAARIYEGERLTLEAVKKGAGDVETAAIAFRIGRALFEVQSPGAGLALCIAAGAISRLAAEAKAKEGQAEGEV